MPLFTYACTKCGHEMESLSRGDARETLACPSCGQNAMQRMPSLFSVGAAAPAMAASPCGSGGCASGACPYAGG